jgi:uncharacterized protein (TIGR02996 family)
MTERDFLLALDEDPDDVDTARVYADWLEDQGETARSQLLRVTLDLEWAPSRHTQSESLYERQGTLQAEIEKKWTDFKKWNKVVSLRWENGIPRLGISDSLPTPRRLRGLPEFPSLTKLSTSTIPMPDSLAALAERTSFHILSLSFRLKDLAPLAGLTDLKGLSFYHAHIGDEELGQLRGLTELRILDLTDCGITDAGMANLAAFPLLERLRLGSTRTTDVGLQHLRSLRHLKELSLTDTAITDAGLENLRDLRQLTRLRLSGTEITDAGIQHLAGLTNLRDLDIAITRATAAGFDTLLGLKKLRQLRLCELAGINDTTMQRLVALPELRDLDLGRTEVTRYNLGRLATQLPNLRRVRMDATLGLEEQYREGRELRAFLAHMEEANLLVDIDYE